MKCNEIHLEIGCGKGDYWINMASLYPQTGWIAFEKVDTVAGIALKKAIESDHDLSNMRLACVDANDLLSIFNPGEIATIHLNFSDPWPKKRHEKRRLTSFAFQKLYYEILQDDGIIIQKTDNVSLFNYSLVAMQELFTLDAVDVDFRRQAHDEDSVTEYEQKFIDLGQPIFRAVYRKKTKQQD